MSCTCEARSLKSAETLNRPTTALQDLRAFSKMILRERKGPFRKLLTIGSEKRNAKKQRPKLKLRLRQNSGDKW
jgi:hypothetical protein